MLDTHGRKYVEPIIESVANGFINRNISANKVTVLAFVLGISSGIWMLMGAPLIATAVLWISGLLDAVDGAIARKTGTSSSWGALMDITFDRIVELSVIISLAVLYPQARLVLIMLTGSIIISMTVFLTVGALSKNTKNKAFYYQAGLAERTEGFIMSSLMMLFSNHIIIITIVYFLAILFTAGQRLKEAYELLKN
ncbi:Phosphatidylglycerophosphate synthase [Acetoanaerobium noterae]|uniref:Phosphatidylglycerophosphate synthase n=1 Tax=Acetoanaerobium noterae TaxID=745369 RepID=A0A1T5BHB5_9FIRM|nr:CDP-alcohol phosphatidyltransferase family protein [Acetoanaerobium noterae]SKB46477.1 Phosphatidylglycerophosphate synthase [Acetoanaerobium noterae]